MTAGSEWWIGSPASPQAEACAGKDSITACCTADREESSHAVTAHRAFIFASTSVSAAANISEGRGGPVKSLDLWGLQPIEKAARSWVSPVHTDQA